jgi:hypothetical protein
MVQRVATVAFEGIEARAVDVQVQVAPGLPAFNVVGLPDKAVSEARERVRAALVASGLALPARRITVNLAPADVPKEGQHKQAFSMYYCVPLSPHVPLNSKTYFLRLSHRVKAKQARSALRPNQISFSHSQDP